MLPPRDTGVVGTRGGSPFSSTTELSLKSSTTPSDAAFEIDWCKPWTSNGLGLGLFWIRLRYHSGFRPVLPPVFWPLGGEIVLQEVQPAFEEPNLSLKDPPLEAFFVTPPTSLSF